jgi:transcription-repair coupling factor (superfamily II helicase)
LPRPGARLILPASVGASDALLLARCAAEGAPLAILTANSQDAQRLLDEIRYFAPNLVVRHFPDWETLPYDQFSPHQDLVSERLATLYEVQRGGCAVLVAAATTALQRLAPLAYIAAHTFFLRKGDELQVDALRRQLTLAGYTHVTQVVAPGEWSQRGGLLDLFPMGSALPYRIDLDDESIQSLCVFDPDTQRRIHVVPELRLLPAREFPLEEAARTRFRSRYRETFEGDPSKSAIYRDVSNGVAPAGIEYYLPLFFDATASLFDYLPRECRICLHGTVEQALTEFWGETRERYRNLNFDRNRPLLPPEDLYLSTEEFYANCGRSGRLDLRRSAEPGDKPFSSALPRVAVERKAADPLAHLREFVRSFDGRVLLAADSPGRRETMIEFLAEHSLKPALCADFAEVIGGKAEFNLTVAPLSNGFVLPQESFALITEAELYAETARSIAPRDRQKPGSIEGMVRDLAELKVGDPVVHVQHGIGRYLGLVNLDLGEGETEFLHVLYADDAKLYVPVAQLHVVARYSGAQPELAPLHRLGSGQWEKAKRKAAEQVRDTAAELLNLYARRASRVGHAFEFKPADLDAFADGFGFQETPDQATAIAAVVADLKSDKPMDRLVCGDVGFGKTEVALRAAFVAVAGGKQVAVLTPTTLLTEQHFETFSDRFADFPVRVAELSRFRTGKEQARVLAELADGKVDVVIGTHRLLQSDIRFARLGLVIIDEEHRFGVRQKEALKQLRSEVDVLTLTATPIPRSLAMALEGIRDFSVITTAPQKRLAIKTFVVNDSPGTIREACLRELKRGGQIYFLHNEVESIEATKTRIDKLLPEARSAIAHGQMHERELERVMRDFYQQRFNLLICTTIIETGIDVPTANTIIIHRADKFGLAQLHQLRGRVGRSHHQAYAYLLTVPDTPLSATAKKRLEAIQMMEELGSGFFLAMHDLEIRGAGEVLGDQQSGDIQEVGFNLYNDMLTEAVAALRAGREPDLMQPLAATIEINLHTPALLPNDYCSDIHQRLVLYKRLANCGSLDAIDSLREELVDRFGRLPPPAQALIETHRLRVLAKPLGVARLDANAESISLQFQANPSVDPARIIRLVQTDRAYRLAGQDKLRVSRSSRDLPERAAAVRAVLSALAG